VIARLDSGAMQSPMPAGQAHPAPIKVCAPGGLKYSLKGLTSLMTEIFKQAQRASPFFLWVDQGVELCQNRSYTSHP
jgi:hypothetical protein